jgi:hypothetical protein
MTSYRLCEQLLALERRVRSLYILLSRRQQFPAELRAVWEAMVGDETSHIVALERSAHLFSVMDFPPAIPDQVLTSVEAMLADAEATIQQPGLTSDDAFRQALRIEGSELTRLEEAWLRGFRSTTALLLQTLTPEEQPHIGRLVEAVRRFSSDAALHKEADALWAQYDKSHHAPVRIDFPC